MIVLIDGDCALCVGLVEWLGKRIPQELLSPEHIIFVPGESDLGSELLSQFEIREFDSVVVIDQGQVFRESEAVLALNSVLPRQWKALGRLSRIVPRPVRDGMYRWIARNRFTWFGRAEVCPLDSRVATVTYGPRGLLTRP